MIRFWIYLLFGFWLFGIYLEFEIWNLVFGLFHEQYLTQILIQRAHADFLKVDDIAGVVRL